MKKSTFPYMLFFSLLVLCSVVTFFTANTLSVSRHTSTTDMIAPFPLVLQLADGTIQVVNAEHLQKLQLPDPQNQTKMSPNYLLEPGFFKNGIMPAQAIIGTSLTNGQSIHIPVNYSAQVSGKQLDSTNQEITITYVDGANEDQVITTIYKAKQSTIEPKMQFVKEVLIWKTIFMNGMMLSLVLPFIICKRRMKRSKPEVPSTP